MEELIKTFHIEINLLIAQIVNFSIVLFVLYKFAYGPILKALNDRTKKIEVGMKDAEESRKKLEEMTEKEKEVLAKAKKDAQEIIKKAEEDARKNVEIITAEAQIKTEKLIEENRKAILTEKEIMLAEVKTEIVGLVIAATEKIISEKMDSEKDRALMEAVIK